MEKERVGWQKKVREWETGLLFGCQVERSEPKVGLTFYS
jgi:hypothetical protein